MRNFFGPELIKETSHGTLYSIPFPSEFSSAVINGDDSGLTSAGVDELQTLISDLKEWFDLNNISFESVSEESYVGKFYGVQTLLSDYVILVR